jgi:signal transduction histidine kinase
MSYIDNDGLEALRGRAANGLLIFLCLHVPFNFAVAVALGVDWRAPTLIGAMLALAATISWRASGSALSTQLTIAVALVGMVALLVFELTGHPWQLDIHLYFFVALAALAVFCEPRVLIMAAVAIAAHHLLVNFILPAAIYPGGADLGRVGLHAGIVALETIILVWLTQQLIALFRRSDEKEAELELARTEGRRRDAIMAEQDKSAALGRLAGGVAHEINNLLQPAIIFPELVRDRLPPEDIESREDLDLVLESVRKAREIVRNILLYSRKQEPALETVDLAAEIAKALAFVHGLLPPGISLQRHIEAAEVMAAINKTQLTQVLTNLVINAAHASGDHGTIDVTFGRMRPSAEQAEALEIEAGALYLTLAVADNGTGMDASTVTRIFEPFFTTKPLGVGTGLGLSVVFGILKSWKGAIAVDSALGRGTVFTLYIPMADQQGPVETAAPIAA